MPELTAVRPALLADAKEMARRWAASPEADPTMQLVAWPVHDESMFRAYLSAPGHRGYISNMGLLIIKESKLPEKRAQAEEPFVWLVRGGLNDADHDETFRQLFLFGYREARNAWAFGDIPPNARDRSFRWARSWCEEEVILPNKWHRLMCRVAVGIERLESLGPTRDP